MKNVPLEENAAVEESEADRKRLFAKYSWGSAYTNKALGLDAKLTFSCYRSLTLLGLHYRFGGKPIKFYSR